MEWIKRAGGWLVAAVLWLWTILPKTLDWVGRTTLPEDWEQLTAEKLPAWAAWLFSTPWWVPTLLAVALTAWMIWISRPQSPNTHRIVTDRGSNTTYAGHAELEIKLNEDGHTEPDNKHSVNVYDATAVLFDNDSVIIHVIFDKPIYDPLVKLNISYSTSQFKYDIAKYSSRFCAIRLYNVTIPCTVWIDIHSKSQRTT